MQYLLNGMLDSGIHKTKANAKEGLALGVIGFQRIGQGQASVCFPNTIAQEYPLVVSDVEYKRILFECVSGIMSVPSVAVQPTP
jgi:hypothetical protein